MFAEKGVLDFSLYILISLVMSVPSALAFGNHLLRHKIMTMLSTKKINITKFNQEKIINLSSVEDPALLEIKFALHFYLHKSGYTVYCNIPG